jgi:hypothetical protein
VRYKIHALAAPVTKARVEVCNIIMECVLSYARKGEGGFDWTFVKKYYHLSSFRHNASE